MGAGPSVPTEEQKKELAATLETSLDRAAAAIAGADVSTPHRRYAADPLPGCLDHRRRPPSAMATLTVRTLNRALVYVSRCCC